MKITFYKAKHFWENRECATWKKSTNFNEIVFNTLKEKYEELKYSKENYISIDSKIIFLFYQSKKDIYDRPITEITVLASNTQILDKDRVYQILKSSIIDLFDDNLDYVVEMDTKLVKSKKIFLFLYWTLSFLLIFSVSSYLYMRFPIDTGENNFNNIAVNNIELKSKNNKNDGKLLNSIIHNQKKEKKLLNKDKYKVINKIKSKKQLMLSKKKTFLDKFCKKNNIDIENNNTDCYIDFIHKKCNNRMKYKNNYMSFINGEEATNCIDLKGIKKVSDDLDLKGKFKQNEMKFFTKE